MTLVDTTGFVAAALTTVAFVPQVVHSYRTRDVAGISLAMYATFTLGLALWLAYGLLVGAWPVIVANALTLTMALSILRLKLLSLRPPVRPAKSAA